MLGRLSRPGFDPAALDRHNSGSVFTALIIAILVVAGAATVVGGGLVLASQRRKQLADGGSGQKALPAGSGDRLLERTVRDLRVGDVVQYGGADFVVEGVVEYDEAGHRWVAGRLVDVDKECWLMVGLERSTSGSMRLLDADPSVEMSGYPPELLVVGSTRYKFEKRGTATAKLTGDVGSLAGNHQLAEGSVARCRWWQYESASADALVVEQWGDDYRVLRGRVVSDAELDMMPGS